MLALIKFRSTKENKVRSLENFIIKVRFLEKKTKLLHLNELPCKKKFVFSKSSFRTKLWNETKEQL